MSDLRIKGDLAKMPRPTKGLAKRILANSTPKKECPRCKRELPYEKFFYYSLTNYNKGVPSATATRTCTTCRNQRSSKRKRA
jgi:hypothetical protein